MQLIIISDLDCLDLTNTKVLILIQSSPASVDRREANRKTWMTFTESFPQVKVLFVFGTTAPDEQFVSIR